MLLWMLWLACSEPVSPEEAVRADLGIDPSAPFGCGSWDGPGGVVLSCTGVNIPGSVVVWVDGEVQPLLSSKPAMAPSVQFGDVTGDGVDELWITIGGGGMAYHAWSTHLVDVSGDTPRSLGAIELVRHPLEGGTPSQAWLLRPPSLCARPARPPGADLARPTQPVDGPGVLWRVGPDGTLEPGGPC